MNIHYIQIYTKKTRRYFNDSANTMNGSMIINIFNEKNDENDKIFMWKWNSSFLRSSNDERFVNS